MSSCNGKCQSLVPLVVLLFFYFLNVSHAAESICYGTTGNGSLENGVKLPSRGNNFISYGTLPELLGRTYVHSRVRNVIIDAYRALETEQPGKVFKYAETGAKDGGEFTPHKTHQNGLSVDFTVPVLDRRGNSIHLPTNPFNKYGYSIEFDENGTSGNYTIDFEAMGAHIVALHKASRNNGIEIWRMLLDPRLQKHLYASSYGDYIKENITIPEKKSWVRHDDHYHVDFKVDCNTQR